MSAEGEDRRPLLLVLNAGSSSLKAGLFAEAADGTPEPLARLAVNALAGAPRLSVRDRGGASIEDRPAAEVAPSSYESAVDLVLARAGALGLDRARIGAVGHRVVHGGADLSVPELVTPELVGRLETIAHLARHHQPANISGIRAIASRLPGVPQVACFDTAFHATQPAIATRLPLPRDYRARGYRRYGFHGISYGYIVERFAAATGRDLPGRLILAHLGNGASMCAARDGRSIATTMGFSTLDGLVMGTRSGAIDPGVVIALLRDEGHDAASLEHLLYDRSGLLGLSGLSADMRALLASPEPAAAEAVEAYCYWAARHAGSLMVALGGCEGIVFTGGVGENAPAVRAAIVAHLAWAGAVADADANARGAVAFHAPASRIGLWTIPTDEERAIARETLRVTHSTRGMAR